MGLDMTLSRRTYVKNWGDTPSYLIKVERVGKECPIKADRISHITEELVYWRKANAIHKWFVNNVQDGEDDCKDYYVETGKLESLLETVNEVLGSIVLVEGQVSTGERLVDGKWVPITEPGKVVKDSSVAEELLPTTKGCFFGSTAYDEYYVEDLKYTRDALEKVLAEPQEGDLYYSSSW